ncbi:UNVERIFIED_CONTAM: Cytochrome b6 [Sesamum indicum]
MVLTQGSFGLAYDFLLNHRGSSMNLRFYRFIAVRDESLIYGSERGILTYLNKVYDWFEERLEIQAIADDITIQVATGFAMTFYYRPTVTEAFASVQYIMTEANFGWLIRSVHRWSASMMVLMMILHVFRVYLTGGFKKPRELTWVTGVVLAVLTASFGVTGYSLPRDQIGYWAVKIVTGVPEAIPVIGSPLVELLRGSASVGQSTLTRFYSLHTFVLPLLTAIYVCHIGIHNQMCLCSNHRVIPIQKIGWFALRESFL